MTKYDIGKLEIGDRILVTTLKKTILENFDVEDIENRWKSKGFSIEMGEDCKKDYRWLPTTKMSPVSGKNIEIGLKDRIFVDGDFSEDRDVKSAKTVLTFGLFNSKLTSKELRSLPVEDLISAFKRFYPFEGKLEPMNQEAPSFKAG